MKKVTAMKKVIVCTALALAAGITLAEAKGCIKGAVVGPSLVMLPVTECSAPPQVARRAAMQPTNERSRTGKTSRVSRPLKISRTAKD
jgi:hypothetical protein